MATEVLMRPFNTYRADDDAATYTTEPKVQAHSPMQEIDSHLRRSE